MTRHRLFAILALTGLVLTIPDPTVARPGFRTAFTTGPFRIVLPMGRPHLSGGPRFHGPAMTPKPPKAQKPAVHTVKAGAEPFRRHHRVYGALYPVTVGGDGSYYGAPYDPSDMPVYAPPIADEDAPPTLMRAQPYPVASAERGCSAQRVLMPNRYGAESEVTIIRC
jgi:hypothetical protein